MKWIAASLLCMLLAISAQAQDDARPIIETELDVTEVVPGQPVVLRVTVLVPTWLAKPIEFPTFEAPELMVKLFEGATNPTSRTIAGETWSGVSRAYRLSPMVPGTIRIPAQEVPVHWAVPGKTDPNIDTLTIEGFAITGLVPKKAEGLTPFVAASALEIKQEISTEVRVLKPGDSLTRTITVEVTGASPLSLPALMENAWIEGLALYPSEPVIEERAEDGWLSGSRRESVTLVAQSGGSGRLPPIEIAWFNLDKVSVETARVDGIELSVDAPVARARRTVDAATVLWSLAALAVGVLLVFSVVRYGIPQVARAMARRKDAWEASEPYAYKQVRAAIGRQDYSGFQAALLLWHARVPGLMAPELDDAIASLGACYFSRRHSDPSSRWLALSTILADARAAYLSRRAVLAAPVSGPINPVGV